MSSIKTRATCHTCGRHSRWGTPSPSGRVDLYEVGAGWWVAPYPADYVHQDGSRGDWWTCPACAQHRAA